MARRKPDAPRKTPRSASHVLAKTPAAGKAGAWRVMNRVQLAVLMGVHEDTVTDFARNGMPVLRRGGAGREGQYDAVQCLAWWREQQGKNAKEAAQTRLFQANASKAETELQRIRGELLPRGEIILAGQSFARGLRAKVLSLATRARHHGIITRDQESGLAALCREILLDISSWKAVTDALSLSDEDAEVSS